MKPKLTLLLISASMALAAPPLRAQTTNTLPFTNTVHHQIALDNDRLLGERALLPPGLKEKIKLTKAQRTELEPIEKAFATTSIQYQAANQSRINSAQEGIRRARASKDTVQIEAARRQLQDVWVGLQRDRQAAVNRIKPLLTPDQLTILEDPGNQWRENHRDERNDPSSN